jgi:hypothetical protein
LKKKCKKKALKKRRNLVERGEKRGECERVSSVRGVVAQLVCDCLRPKVRHERKNKSFFGGQASSINSDPKRTA